LHPTKTFSLGYFFHFAYRRVENVSIVDVDEGGIDGVACKEQLVDVCEEPGKESDE
jgi:hypothetical protein